MTDDKPNILQMSKKSLNSLKIVIMAISAVSLIVGYFDLWDPGFDPSWIAIVLCGVPIFYEAIEGLVTKFDIKADLLVAIALVAAVSIGEYFAAGEVALIMGIGGLLEDITSARAEAGIERLVKLKPKTACLIRDGIESTVDIDDIAVGDVIRVLPGEAVAVDGKIIRGSTSIDQSTMTGESIPVDKTVGDDVYSGTVNQFNSFDMEATKVGKDSSLQKTIELVRSADARKAKVVRTADKWATWLVIISVSCTVLTFFVTGEAIRAVSVLVVFCPCALVLSVPTAIVAANYNLAKNGVLVRNGDATERMASVDTVVLDKTGTITYGRPAVTKVVSVRPDISDGELYSILASAEKLSEHPLGRSIVSSFDGTPGDPEEFSALPGMGVSASVSGKKVIAGNRSLMESSGVPVDKILCEDGTVVYVSVDGRFSGYATLADPIRESAVSAIADLHAMGMSAVVLTGDNEGVGKSVADAVGADRVVSECLPGDKLNEIERMESDGKKVCMVGDGVNDAPALEGSSVGIAMGGLGSDMAIDAADIVLVGDDIGRLPHIAAMSRKMMSTIKINIAFAMTVNIIATILAITGVLSPVTGALVHNCSSVIVVINSALLMGWRMKGEAKRDAFGSVQKESCQ